MKATLFVYLYHIRGPPVNKKVAKHPICNGLEHIGGERLATFSPSSGMGPGS